MMMMIEYEYGRIALIVSHMSLNSHLGGELCSENATEFYLVMVTCEGEVGTVIPIRSVQ